MEHSKEDLIEELAAARVENERLVQEVSRLKTQIADLSYGKLEAERPASPDVDRGVFSNLLNTVSGDAMTPLVSKLRDSPETIGLDITALQAAGKIDEARQLALLAIRATPGNPSLHMRWVRQVRYSKDHELGLAMCATAFDVDGGQHLLWLNRGYLQYEAGRYQEAAADFDKAAASVEKPIEERLAAAASRARVGETPNGLQAQIIADYFDPTAATFNARRLDGAKVRNSLQRFGCAWIKGLFEPSVLAEFDHVISVNTNGVGEMYRALGLPETFNVGFPLYFASEANREKAQGLFQSSYPHMFDPAKMNGADNTKLANYIFKRMAKFGLHRAVRDYLSMTPLYSSAAICHIRNFIPSGFKWFGEFHQDNRLYNSDAEILTPWFPFRYQHGPMPSLEFLPLKSKSHLPCVSVCGIDNEMFEPQAFWRPAYQLGDAMLLSGFVPHRTYVEQHMTLERTSVDFRFFASPVPNPIYEPSFRRHIPKSLKQAVKLVLGRAH